MGRQPGRAHILRFRPALAVTVGPGGASVPRAVWVMPWVWRFLRHQGMGLVHQGPAAGVRVRGPAPLRCAPRPPVRPDPPAGPGRADPLVRAGPTASRPPNHEPPTYRRGPVSSMGVQGLVVPARGQHTPFQPGHTLAAHRARPTGGASGAVALALRSAQTLFHCPR